MIKFLEMPFLNSMTEYGHSVYRMLSAASLKKKKKPKGTHTKKPKNQKPVNNRLFLFSLKKKPEDRGVPKLVHLAAQ